jgi:hypothetical protein
MIMNKENKKKEGKKFRVIVEHGELYLECIDSFEEIFEISQEYVSAADKRVELTDILDPYLFENHRDIVNALFEVYYDVSEDYLKLHDKESSKAINNAAKESVSKRFGLDGATEREVVAKRSMNEVRDMIRETRDMKKN